MNVRQIPLDPSEAKPPEADHRHRVARERRARMRERLIAATKDVYSRSAGGRRPDCVAGASHFSIETRQGPGGLR